METATLKLQGMGCAACATAIEQAIRDVSGVADCNVNFGVEQAIVAIQSAMHRFRCNPTGRE